MGSSSWPFGRNPDSLSTSVSNMECASGVDQASFPFPRSATPSRLTPQLSQGFDLMGPLGLSLATIPLAMFELFPLKAHMK